VGIKTVQTLLTLFILVSLNFFLPRLMPGDPLSYLDNNDPGAGSAMLLTEETRSQLLAYYGLDRPLGEQYLRYLGGLLRGDLGWSIYYNAPVRDVLWGRLKWTLLLVGTATAIYVTLGIGLGALSAWKRGTPADAGLLVSTFALGSWPSFFLAMLLVIAFGLHWQLFPVGGARSPYLLDASRWEKALDVAYHMVLPVAALVLTQFSGVYMLMRNAMLGVLGEDYIRTAYGKGAPERRVLFQHAVPNALLPIVTMIAMRLGFVLTGSMFVEVVFAYPGMGTMTREACMARDYPMLQGAFLVTMLFIMVCNLAVDLLYGWLDPRVGPSGTREVRRA
jgi:peptide/nickel transport system permease protein